MDQIVKYDVTDAAVSQMKKDYMALTIAGIEDKEGFDRVHDARMTVKGMRVDIEKRRKQLKADALEWGRKVDTEAKRLTALLSPIEDHLYKEESKITEEKARIKAEEERKEQLRIQTRIDELAKYDTVLPFFEVAALSDDAYQTILDIAIAEHGRIQMLKEAEERQRIESERQERAKREAEQLALAAEREKLETARKEQEAREAAIREEREHIEAEKRKLEEEKRIEAAKKEAAERALKEEAERQEREAAEKKRQEELKPDKEKAIAFLNSVFMVPQIKDNKIAVILDELIFNISPAVDTAKQKIRNL